LISSIAVSTNKQWIASAEHNGVNGKPTIHVWNAESLLNAALIQASHRGSIVSMSFINNDEMLVTIGTKKPAPLILYRWKRKIAIYSTILWSIPLEIRPRNNEGSNIIDIITKTKLIEISIVNDIPQFKEYCCLEGNELGLKIITTGAMLYISEETLKVASKRSVLAITGHPNGTVVYWAEGKTPTVQGNYQSLITNIEPLADSFVVSTVAGQIYMVISY
jgi:hypothetical protein